MPGPKQSLAQFGQTIKAKHPEYGDMKDEDVANKVLAKYPEYGDMVDTNASSSPANPTLGQYLGNVGTGALRGMASTISGLDDFATKHLPTFMTTPIGQAATPENSARATAYAKQLGTPTNDMQKFGKGIEQAGEFMVPGSLEKTGAAMLAPRIARYAPSLTKAAPVIAKMITSGVGTGAVNAAQGGSAAGGAAAGIAGTILGTGIGAAIPTMPSIKMAGSRILAPGSVGDILVRALKPAVTTGPAGEVADSLAAALPKALEQNPTLNGVAQLGTSLDSARAVQGQAYSDVVAPYRKPAIGPYRPSSIDGNPIANAQIQSIPAMNLLEDTPTYKPATAGKMKTVNVSAGDNRPGSSGLGIFGTPEKATADQMRLGAYVGGSPATSTGGIVNRTADKAANYRTGLSVPQLDDVRVDANQKLNSFYNKAGGDQAAALSDPETARVKAVGDTTRQVLYPVLDANAGLPQGSVSQMQTNFGQLTDAANIANKRSLVFGRQDPVSLAQKIAVGHGGVTASLLNVMKEKAIQSMTNSDGLVQSAVDRLQNPGAPTASLKWATPTLTPPSLFGAGVLGTGLQLNRPKRQIY